MQPGLRYTEAEAPGMTLAGEGTAEAEKERSVGREESQVKMVF